MKEIFIVLWFIAPNGDHIPGFAFTNWEGCLEATEISLTESYCQIYEPEEEEDA